jgi:hypothetical protein
VSLAYFKALTNRSHSSGRNQQIPKQNSYDHPRFNSVPFEHKSEVATTELSNSLKMHWFCSRNSKLLVVAVTKLHASSQRRTSPQSLWVCNSALQHCKFAYAVILSCLHLLVLHCLCWNAERFCCDLEAWSLLIAGIVLNKMKFKHFDYENS